MQLNMGYLEKMSIDNLVSDYGVKLTARLYPC